MSFVDSMSSTLALVNNSNGGNPGNGNCANIPLIASGLKTTNRVTIGAGFVTHEVEYIEVTETQLKKTDKETSSSGKITNSLIEENYIIANNYIEKSGTSTSDLDKPNKPPFITTNTPSVRVAVNEVCVNQTWQDDYDLTSVVAGQNFTTKVSLKNTVEAVNESITTSAGTFNTVRLRHIIGGLESFSWTSTEYGVVVRVGVFKEGSGEFVGTEELISVQ